MTTVFSKILDKSIPSFKILEDDYFYSFLDCRPISPGHTLVIPKVQVDHFYDMPEEYLTRILMFSKPIVNALEKTIECLRVGSMVAGLEVPHAHLHLVPIVSMKTFSFDYATPEEPENLKRVQQAICQQLH